MTMRRAVVSGIAAATLFCGGILLAQKPERDISGKRHPNLAAAQRLCDQAFRKISEAQEANEFDMQGHAAKAKELLEQANKELKEAAEAANKDKR
ncbi:MAG: hypothetical protein JSS69_13300 [Acidobacteria bacterium]|nr:hypothetical protein [Acidobacteriota bacterium]MBS1866885.1 hypothetical protein [Acidobacteriota bacterium]